MKWVLVIIILSSALVIYANWSVNSECKARGGTAIRGTLGTICASIKEIK